MLRNTKSHGPAIARLRSKHFVFFLVSPFIALAAQYVPERGVDARESEVQAHTASVGT